MPRPRAERSAGQIEAEAVEQFTVHAESFAAAAVINDERALSILDELAAIEPGDRVIDVACGPGIVTCRLARHGAPVVAIDLTPRMLELAAERSAAAGLTDLTPFTVARMDHLPFPDGSFTVAVNRYALHHAADPEQVAAELVRVVAPGGRLVIVDFAAGPNPIASAAYDDAERLRDPSHVGNLTPDEQQQLFLTRGCRLVAAPAYRIEARLATVLAGSHGPDHDGFRRAFEASLDGHRLGVNARRVDSDGDGAIAGGVDGAIAGDIAFDYPIVAQLFSR